MSGPSLGALSAASHASGIEACRRIAERLGFDVVGVVANGDGRRAAWWTSPGAPPLPPRLEDVLEGRSAGWVVCPLAGATTFGRLGDRAEPRSAIAFREAAPSLAAAVLDGSSLPGSEDADRPDVDHRPPRPISPELSHAAVAVRAQLAGTDGTGALLEAVRRALGAERLFLLRERGPDLEIAGAPVQDWPRTIPAEIRGGLERLARDGAIEEGTARQLGVVLGAGGQAVQAAFCAGAEEMEVLVGSWDEDRGVAPETFTGAAALIGASRVALECRARSVDARVLHDRTRWAFEIHDGVTQAVTSAALELHNLRHRIEADPRVAAGLIAEVELEVRRSLGELRALLFDLSGPGEPSSIPDLPIAAAIRGMVDRWKLPPRITIEGDVASLPKPVLDAAFMVLREGVTNAAKHAASSHVEIRVAVEGAVLAVEVSDRGRGFAPSETLDGPHFGLDLMKRKVEEIGGTFEVESSPGKGTRVVARLPVRERGEQP